MANQIPFSGATGAAGGYLLPDAQGELLTNGILQEAGTLQLVGDRRTTGSRKEVFPIWLGQPTAGPVGEGAVKPVTGGEFGQTNLNVKKFASIVMFTDEQIEDVQNGDINVLVDSGVREAIADSIDAHMLGLDSGAAITGVFDTELSATTNTVEVGTAPDALRLAISGAMGKLEANGYRNPGNMSVLLAPDVAQHLRDARSGADATQAVYDNIDPLYGLQRAFSTNLPTFSGAAALGRVVGIVAYRPNLHVRLRTDVNVKVSSDATVFDGVSNRNMFQENLTAIRYETRLGFMAHDLNRAVVALVNAA